MVKPPIKVQLESFSSIEELLHFFEIDFDRAFLHEYGQQLQKRFNGNVLIANPQDWFDYRRALKNAYCKIQRGRLDPKFRSACRGCTSCERR